MVRAWANTIIRRRSRLQRVVHRVCAERRAVNETHVKTPTPAQCVAAKVRIERLELIVTLAASEEIITRAANQRVVPAAAQEHVASAEPQRGLGWAKPSTC